MRYPSDQDWLKGPKMRFSSIAILCSCVALTACGGIRESRINPVNWFGSSTSQKVEKDQYVDENGEVQEVNPLIGKRGQSRQVSKRKKPGGSIFDRRKKEGPYEGTLVQEVSTLDIRRTSTGAIVAVTGVSSRQGAFDVRLIPTNGGKPVDGVMTYELRALQPIQTAQGPSQTRRLQAAVPLTNQSLEDIRTIRVVARSNVQTSRR